MIERHKKFSRSFIISFSLVLVGIGFMHAAPARYVYRYNGSSGTSDSANSIIFGADSNIYAAGYSTNSGTLQDFTVISLTTTGDTNWTYKYDGGAASNDQALHLAYGLDGNIYAAGYSRSTILNINFTVISLTTSGDTNWTYIYNGSATNSDDRAYSITCGADTNIYAVGYSTGSTLSDFTVISLNTDGDTNWTYIYNGPASGADIAYNIIYGPDSNLYVIGRTAGSGTGNDFTVISLNTAGDTNWTYRYDGTGNANDNGNTIVYGTDGNLYASGYSTGNLTGWDCMVISLTTAGDTNWTYRYNGTASLEDYALAIAYSDYGGDTNVYAAGYCNNTGSGSDFAVISLNDNGDTNWTYMYNGLGNGSDEARRVVCDQEGNIYAAGHGTGSGTGTDFTVISLNTSGDTNWTYILNGPGNGADGARAIVYGLDTNLYSAGFSTGSGTGRDFVVTSLVSVPTYTNISYFNAHAIGNSVAVEWQTASEIGTIGFHLLRRDETTGEYIQVNKKLLPGLLHCPQGGTYRYVDETALPGGSYTYKLVEVEANGSKTEYGPYPVKAEKKISDYSLESNIMKYSKEPHGCLSKSNHCEECDSSSVIAIPSTAREKQSEAKCHSDPEQSEAEESHEIPRSTQDDTPHRIATLLTVVRNDKRSCEMRRTSNNLKITVDADGLYYLSAEGIANVFGMPVAKVSRLIRDNNLMLSNRGESVAWLAAPGNLDIYFYAQKMAGIYADENIYWLIRGRGLRMEVISGIGPDPTSGEETFSDAVHFEENNYALTALFTDPESDYWFWDYIIAEDPQFGTKAFNFSVNGVASTSTTAALTLNFQGATNTEANPDHHVVISLNGANIGESYWDGLASHNVTVTFNQGLLNEGENTLTVTGLLDSGVEYSIFYVNFFDISYQRLYQAIDNSLFCQGDDNPVVTISGFNNSNISLFDITNALRPKLIRATTIDNIGSTYRLSFYPTSDNHYLASTSDAVSSPVSVIADVQSNLHSSYNRADYVMITPTVFKDVIQPLADYRQNQGVRTMVIDLEDIMDEFNYGISSPVAIHDFLTYAYERWRSTPKYVLLVGNGTYDYKDFLGYSDNLMPPLMTGTPNGLFASDNQLVDVTEENGMPEMVIGRLPVTTAEELQAVVNKIIGYEQASGFWLYNVLMLADNPDEGGNFTLDSDDLAGLIPPEYITHRIYLAEHPIEEARQMVLNGINDGALLMNFFGHAGLTQLCQEGLLTVADVDSLNNEERLPIMTAMTCVVGRYEIPGYTCLSEALVLKNNGGAIATWAPTGLCYNSESKILDKGFFEAAFGQYEQTLGEMVLNGLAAYARTRSELYVLYVYNLIGDPALQVR